MLKYEKMCHFDDSLLLEDGRTGNYQNIVYILFIYGLFNDAVNSSDYFEVEV
jgi:hypothetical protein